jgi:uncharacterized membrane protein
MGDRDDATGGAALAGLAIALGGAAFGAFLSSRHARRGHDDAPEHTRRQPEGDLTLVGRTVTIRKDAKEIYEFWRDFSNLPRVMDNLARIEIEGGDARRSTWHIKAPAGRTVAVETEVVEDEPGKVIAWRSRDGSDITTNGRVTFQKAPGERGTRVSLVMEYDPPAGAVGRAVAKLFLREPAVQARHDLKRLKMLMETGEIATSARNRELAGEANSATEREMA